MAARKPSAAKAERPSYENKAVARPAANKASGFIRVRVIKSHDGIDAGTVFSKPEAIAKQMINLGFWERV